MWLLHRMAPDSAAYNVALAVCLRGEVDGVALDRAVRMVVRRHPELRSVYREADGLLRKEIADDVPWGLDVRDGPHATVADVAAQPFDLGNRVFRAVLVRGEADTVLTLVTHHIGSDATSQWLLLRDLVNAYRAVVDGTAPEWPRLLATYEDFAEAERHSLSGTRGAELREYWRQVCAAAPPAELVPDLPRRAGGQPEGESCRIDLPEEVALAARETARRLSVTPAALLAGCLQALLYRLTGRSRFLVGVPGSVRLRRAFRDVVGHLANTMVLRADIDADATCAVLAAAADRRLKEGMAHVDLPHAVLRRTVRADGSPLCRIGFTVLNTDVVQPPLPMAAAGSATGHEITWRGLRLALLDVPQMAGQFDLAVEVRHGRRELNFVVKYDRGLFRPATAARFGDQLARVVRTAAADPHVAVAELSLVDDGEVERLLALGTGS
ncbi:hypothetical protein GCM10009565_46350 [Amycolatopsis albidoflavus]